MPPALSSKDITTAEPVRIESKIHKPEGEKEQLVLEPHDTLHGVSRFYTQPTYKPIESVTDKPVEPVTADNDEPVRVLDKVEARTTTSVDESVTDKHVMDKIEAKTTETEVKSKDVTCMAVPGSSRD